MTCSPIPGGVICGPSSSDFRRRVLHCPTCNTTRRFVVCVQEWYDPIATCCFCGDSWEGGVRLPRPFKRGWRTEASESAKRRWKEAG